MFSSDLCCCAKAETLTGVKYSPSTGIWTEAAMYNLTKERLLQPPEQNVCVDLHDTTNHVPIVKDTKNVKSTMNR